MIKRIRAAFTKEKHRAHDEYLEDQKKLINELMDDQIRDGTYPIHLKDGVIESYEIKDNEVVKSFDQEGNEIEEEMDEHYKELIHESINMIQREEWDASHGSSVSMQEAMQERAERDAIRGNDLFQDEDSEYEIEESTIELNREKREIIQNRGKEHEL